MASTGTVYVTDSLKGRKGNVIVVGRLKVGNDAVLEAQSFNLRRVFGIAVTPGGYDRFRLGQGSIGSLGANRYDRTFTSLTGSIGSGGSLNNYVKMRTRLAQSIGSLTVRTPYKGTFGLYLGTRAGSINSSFIAWGD